MNKPLSQEQHDQQRMRHAIQLAKRGEGAVEPNPMVGCVIVREEKILGQGWHEAYGGPHAEINAISNAILNATSNASSGEKSLKKQKDKSPLLGATFYVTLEPCCHTGKTGPCSQALIEAGARRVVIATRDPFTKVNGGGIAELQAAGIETKVGVCETQARELLAPYLKRVTHGRPWVIAKWAMTLDGKIATSTGSSQWISGPESRQVVHDLRRRVDAIMIGSNTARIDDPLLTARPAGGRTLTRIVLDSQATLSLKSQLVKTAHESPVLVAVGPQADPEKIKALTAAGVEVFVASGSSHTARLEILLDELGKRGVTNLLVEGGGGLLGELLTLKEINEVHAFIAPKIVGGTGSSPIIGKGIDQMTDAFLLDCPEVMPLGKDIYLQGRMNF